MESEIAPKSPKRAKISLDDETDEKTTTEEGDNSSRTSVESKSTALDSNPKSETTVDDVVVISSDDDSDKDGKKVKSEEESPADVAVKTEEDVKTTTSDQPSEQATTEKLEEESKNSSDIHMKDKEESSEQSLESCNSSNVDSNENKPSSKSPDVDDCISQEDLLAHLGLGSVRAISNPKPKKEENISNGVLTERRPLITHKPKESIVDLLRAPKLKSHEEKGKTNGETPVTVVNGVSDDDDSTPGTPSENEDDELIAKEQLIEELRQELRNEEAKLLLLKKIQAAQNDPKGSMKYTKEKENEKLLSSGVQYSSGTKSGSNQLNKKNQLLPPPPPLKTHVSTAGTYQPPVAIQPKILPKVGNVQTIPISPIHVSSKQANQLQSSKSQTRSGSSAIKDLQNVISSMSTNLIHPTPMYPRAGSQGSNVYTTHSQGAPVRPTPVRANNPPSGSSSSGGYASFPTHISSKAPVSTPAVSSAGKQAAAKMALRKQLEKTLLQIPPPKPPPAEWSFIPNLNSAEFMSLVGFEKVVDAIAVKENSKGKSPPLKEKAQQENPKICGQCATDFTPCWKTKTKEGADILMCEKCSTVNVKKELKSEHTARLKAAFLKALKQEQEIEQKMSESTPIAPKPQSSKSSSHQSSSSSSSSRHHHASHHGGVIHRHRHVQGLYHHHQQHPDSLLYQLQQQHLQQQQQEMEVAARRHGDVRWHPYMTQHHHSSSPSPSPSSSSSSSSSHKPAQHHHNIVSDSDRQYLLDMIPSLPAQSLNYSSSRI